MSESLTTKAELERAHSLLRDAAVLLEREAMYAAAGYGTPRAPEDALALRELALELREAAPEAVPAPRQEMEEE